MLSISVRKIMVVSWIAEVNILVWVWRFKRGSVVAALIVSLMVAESSSMVAVRRMWMSEIANRVWIVSSRSGFNWLLVGWVLSSINILVLV